MLRFTQEVKDNWLKALRGRRFKKAMGTLHTSEDKPRYCCLGVLQALYPEDLPESDNGEMLLSSSSIGNKERSRVSGLGPVVQAALAARNDGDGDHKIHSFGAIAKYIENNVPVMPDK